MAVHTQNQPESARTVSQSQLHSRYLSQRARSLSGNGSAYRREFGTLAAWGVVGRRGRDNSGDEPRLRTPVPAGGKPRPGQAGRAPPLSHGCVHPPAEHTWGASSLLRADTGAGRVKAWKGGGPGADLLAVQPGACHSTPLIILSHQT